MPSSGPGTNAWVEEGFPPDSDSVALREDDQQYRATIANDNSEKVRFGLCIIFLRLVRHW